MDVTITKIIGLFSLLGLSLFFGTLPYCLVLRQSGSQIVSQRREKIIKFFNCFAGGVFLGALFLDLMTEGAEEFEKYKEKVGYESEYPFFNALIVVGFFLTSAVEYFAHSFLHTRQSSVSEKKSPPVRDESQSLLDESRAPQNGDNRKDYGSVEEQKTIMSQSQPWHLGHSRCSDVNENDAEDTNGVTFNQPNSNGNFYSFGLRSVLLLLALSFHSVFDGLALGLQNTSSTVWEVFTAIAIHKSVVSFCLGLELFENSSDPKVAAVWMGIFSLISPIGASIGISLTSSGINETAQSLSSSILQALACGAFLYVTFLEILNSCWKNGQRRLFLDIFFAFLGAALMAIAKIFD